MRRDLHRSGEEFTRWLHGADATAPAIVGELLAQSRLRWDELARAFPGLFSCEAVTKLIERAHWLIQRVPQDAVLVSKLAVLVAQNLPIADDGSNFEVLVEIEADAWREHASALLHIENYPEAESAAHEATRLYRTLIGVAAGAEMVERDPVDFHSTLSRLTAKEATLGLIAGQILHALKETSDEGLILVERSANSLLSLFGLKKKYVEGRIIHAKMLIDRQRYDAAIESYQGAADVAEELKDKELVAHILNNVGVCYSRKGDLTQARPCLETARTIFETLGLTAEAIRSRTALVRALVANGRYNEAISEYYATRAAYLAMNLPVAAARVALKIVDLLPLANRSDDVLALCEEMIATFREAGLPREVMQVLAHINALAHTRTVVAQDINDALSIVDRVPDVASHEVGA